MGNDAIRAATIAFENLGKVVANANQWLDKEDFNYENEPHYMEKLSIRRMNT